MKSSGITIVLSALALGVAVFALNREPEARPQRGSDDSKRIAALEDQVSKLSLDLEYAKSAKRQPAQRETSVPTIASPDADPEDAAIPSEGGESDEALAAVVGDVVDRKIQKKIEEMKIKANKKPGIDVFARMLELSKDQRAATERIVAEGQRKLHELLNVPTNNGTNLMDELVEIMARGMAEPGKEHGFKRWIGRIINEKVPGSDTTYAAQLEAVKNGMRGDFKREWTKAQYREFEEWKVDPTEIQNVTDSPNAALAVRIVERARTLGATIPEDK